MVTSKSGAKGISLAGAKLMPMEEMLSVKNSQKKLTLGIPLEEQSDQ